MGVAVVLALVVQRVPDSAIEREIDLIIECGDGRVVAIEIKLRPVPADVLGQARPQGALAATDVALQGERLQRGAERASSESS